MSRIIGLSTESIENESLSQDLKEDEDEEESSHEKRWYALNKSRGVTLSMLISDGMIQPGKRVLSIDYLGRQFVADLLENGNIKTHDDTYNTPSAWAIHCKRIVKPEKKSGCGWASIKYKGKKLDTWKSIWCGKQRPNSPYNMNNNNNNRLSPASLIGENGYNAENGSRVSTPRGFDDSRSDSKFIDSPRSTSSPLTTYNGHNSPIKRPSFNVYTDEIQEEALNLSLHKSDENKNVIREHPCFTYNKCESKSSIKYESIGNRSINIDPDTLVECESFSSYSRVQPFTISITSNALLLMDYHCHLTHSEVVGYLGGKWDSKTQHMSIRQVYPCRCRLGDKDRAPVMEEEIRRSMHHCGLSLVGWYHSHPHSQSDPSMKDISCQMSYQLKMKGSHSNYHPCLGFILAPYDRKKMKEMVSVQAYWVMPAPENRPCDYGIPMSMRYSIHQNESVSEELLNEMKNVVQFYQGSQDLVKYNEEWRNSISYLHKIQASISTRLPKDQTENGSLLDYIQDLLTNVN